MDHALLDRMREDWNQRARSDAKYYVAFLRRNQDDEEFFASGRDLALALTRQFLRLPARRCRRALEIGCGLGRLMRPLAACVGEIHGTDVSDEMVRGAREKLAGIPNAHVERGSGADLADYATESFDFVYSHAVFQHIPATELILGYFAEACRVLSPGGVFWFQANGAPPVTEAPGTWHGARIAAPEIAAFARQTGMLLMAVESPATEYMAVTLQKPPRPSSSNAPPRIVRISCAREEVPVVPARGRLAFASLWIEGLPSASDLNTLEATVGGLRATPESLGPFLGPPEAAALERFIVQLPEGIPPGLHPVQLMYRGEPLAPPSTVRVIPPGPAVPRLVRLSDAVDQLSTTRIASGALKATFEETSGPFQAFMDGATLQDPEVHPVDPVSPLIEVVFHLSAAIGAGKHSLEFQVGTRRFGPLTIEVG